MVVGGGCWRYLGRSRLRGRKEPSGRGGGGGWSGSRWLLSAPPEFAPRVFERFASSFAFFLSFFEGVEKGELKFLEGTLPNSSSEAGDAPASVELKLFFWGVDCVREREKREGMRGRRRRRDGERKRRERERAEKDRVSE